MSSIQEGFLVFVFMGFALLFSAPSFSAECSWMPSGDLACDEFRFETGQGDSKALDPVTRVPAAPSLIPRETRLMPDIKRYLPDEKVGFTDFFVSTATLPIAFDRIEQLEGCSQEKAGKILAEQLEIIAAKHPKSQRARIETINVLEFNVDNENPDLFLGQSTKC